VNPVLMYAKIAVSFLHMYRRRTPQGRYTVAIACAMSGVLVINVWTIVLLILLFDHGWLAAQTRIGSSEFAGLFISILISELFFVDFVVSKLERDTVFVARVGAAPPRLSVWYVACSALMLAVSTGLVIAFK
jgi:hypothetical protein